MSGKESLVPPCTPTQAWGPRKSQVPKHREGTSSGSWPRSEATRRRTSGQHHPQPAQHVVEEDPEEHPLPLGPPQHMGKRRRRHRVLKTLLVSWCLEDLACVSAICATSVRHCERATLSNRRELQEVLEQLGTGSP